MLKSKARGRVAGRAAAAGVVSAGVLLGLTALGARADVRTVTYTCTPSTSGGTAVTRDFTVSLTANTTPVNGTQYIAILNVQPVNNGTPLPAPVEIAAGAALQVQPSVAVSVLPAGKTAGVSSPAPTVAVNPAVTAQGSMPPLPVATLSVTPSAGATSVVLTAKDFKVNMVAPGGTGTTTTTPTLLYTCLIATTGNTFPAAATIPVSASASASASATPSPTASTPRPTRTVYETVYATPSASKSKTKSAQVTHTPGGGAATGGGGGLGPDARVFVLTGTALMLAAATGGLMLRARRRPVRQ